MKQPGGVQLIIHIRLYNISLNNHEILLLVLISDSNIPHDHVKTQSSAHAPPLVLFCSPVIAKTLLVLSYVQPLEIAAPFKETLLTVFSTPRIDMFARGLVS